MKTNSLTLSRIAKVVSIFAVSASIFGCGGGGGGGSSDSSSSNSGGAQTTNGNLATSVPTPTYPSQSAELAMFNQLNDARLKGGFGMLAQSAALDLSTQNHANYLLQNAFAGGLWDDSQLSPVDTATGWLMGHVEKSTNPGFTGVLPINRAAVAGYQASYVGEVVAPLYTSSISQPYGGCVDQLLSTVFHRTGLLNPQLRDFGASVQVSKDGTGTVCVIDPAFTSARVGIVPTGWVSFYPYSGQTGLATTMIYGEAPDPVPSASIKGNPVSIYVEPQNTLNVTSFTLTDSQGTQVPVKLLTKASFPTYIDSATAHIVPTVALKNATTYTVQFVGTNNGAVLSRTWNFTTK